MATSARAPSLELLRLLRRSALPTNNIRVRATIPSIQAGPRSFSTAHCRNAESPASRTSSPASAPSPPSGGQSPSASISRRNPYAPRSHDRGPASEEDTQTDFGAMDIYNNTPEPATSIDACTPGGFHLNNGTKITGGAGVLLAGGEAWSWKPWLGSINNTNSSSSKEGDGTPRISNLLDPRGLLIIPPVSLAVLKLLHPKPDLLLIGTGSRTLMLHPESRRYIVEELGMRIDVMDTANASAAYNLLATERGVEGGGGVGGAMLPVGWKGVEVKKR